jgi:K(+)-stimulated pyrophosphate-energized sodium pump
MTDSRAVVAPMVLSGAGILVSVLGLFLVRAKEQATQKDLLRAMLLGTFTSSVLVLAAIAALAATGFISWGVAAAGAAGLLVGVLIGQATEYYTSDEYRPTRLTAQHARTGPATIILYGFSVGMLSTAVPTLIICAGTLAAFAAAGGFSGRPTAMSEGLYGVAFAGVGMLATLGITLTTDSYGPIADNAGGIAEMSHLGEDVRRRTDALDALGNTTAATGKGFAIASATLTSLTLLAAYMQEIRMWLGRLAQAAPNHVYELPGAKMAFVAGLRSAASAPADALARLGALETQGYTVLGTAQATIQDLARAFNLSVINPLVIGGIILGAMTTFLFCALTIRAVGRTAMTMVEEVCRQFYQRPGIMAGTERPDYGRCVSIATAGAQREMIAPSLLAIIAPVAVGVCLGVPGVVGLLAGAITSGLSLAIMLNNSGGAWDNVKKYIEKGNFGGKGSPAHHAAVVADTVGDPFKDTAGASLNILVKLMSMVAVAFAGLVLKAAPHVMGWLGLQQ